jgi:hypothetical protein
MPKPIIWSYGGGTQSVAIAVLVAQGKLPRPERVVIADTGREAQETWDYTRDVVNPLLSDTGLEVEIAPHSLSTVGLYAKNGDLLIPAYTANGGALPGFCSNEWKKRVIQRWCKANGYGNENPARMWLGISVDEVHRAKPSGVSWLEYWWPLLMDVPRRRDECVNIVQQAGLPTPPRSACWMCPYRSNEEWRHMKEHYPGDFEKARLLERLIQKNDKRDGEIYLHGARIPIDEVPLDHDNLDLFDGCDSGFCFV